MRIDEIEEITMSGKPNPEGVKELSAWLRKLDTARDKVASLEDEIVQKHAALDAAKTDARCAQENVERLMAEMDVRAPGNTGYEGRLLWTLRELNKQAELYGRALLGASRK